MNDAADRTADVMDSAIAGAVRAVQSTPELEDAWKQLEELCESKQKPAVAADAYCAVLGQRLDARVREKLEQRALKYHEEWFGDDPQMMTSLLSRIIESNPAAEWAFTRMTRVLTVAEQWEELLDIYDRALANEQEPERRKKLLDDAAHVAKDFAAEPARAVDYMQQLLALDRGNPQLIASIERLMERAGRWEDLLELWQQQITAVGGETARELRLRSARTCLEKLLDPTRALVPLRELLEELPGHVDACQDLEGILALSTARLETRLEAFTLLRANYDAAERADDAIQVVERAIAFTDGERRRALRRDAGQRLSILERDREAMEHYRALLLEEPADTDARRQLRRLSTRGQQHALRADALVEAATHCADAALRASLIGEAAGIQRAELGAPEVAIGLYQRILDDPEVAAHEAVGAGHDLAQLLRDAGRSDETLSVLERLAQLESSVSARKLILAEAARLSEQLGHNERAVAAWRARLELDADDREALDSLIAVLDQSERHAELLEALTLRAHKPFTPAQQQADLVRIAHVQVDSLGRVHEGIAAWLDVVGRFGADTETLSALDGLMTQCGRFDELVKVLRDALAGDRPTTVSRLCRLGDVLRLELESPVEALGAYVEALELAPLDESARAGLRALLEQPKCAARAGEALAFAYRKCEEWGELVQLLPARLPYAASASERAQLLIDAAGIEERRGAPAEALALLSRALPEEPNNGFLEGRLRRLAQETQQFEELAAAYGAAAGAAAGFPRIAARLHFAQAGVLEHHMALPPAALGAYEASWSQLQQVIAAEPSLPTEPSLCEVQRGLCRCAAVAGDWERAAQTITALCASRDEVEREPWTGIVSEATAQEELPVLCAALEQAITAQTAKLSTNTRYDLELRLAGLYEHGCGELANAERMLRRAIERRPEGREGWQRLGEIQRQTDSPALVETLLALDAIDAAAAVSGGRRDLDSLAEAAERARAQGDDERAAGVLRALYRQAALLCESGEPLGGRRSAIECARLCVEALCEIESAAGRGERAVVLLNDAARLPMPETDRLAYRQRAAQLLASVGRLAEATLMYQEFVAESPNDVNMLRELASLLERQKRISELVSVRRSELELAQDTERRLALRLEIARLVALVENEDGRVKALRANLAEVPGHAESIESLWRLLEERNRPLELADLMTEQAKKLEGLSENERAAELWLRLADLCESRLEDIDRALDAYRRVAELSESPNALSALAKLHLLKKEPAEAARWLKRRLARAEEQERVPILLQLARAQLKAQNVDEAVEALRAAFNEAPRNAEVRRLLFEQYRARNDWEPLAETLGRAATHVTDSATALAYAREAAEIYRDKLGSLDRAVEVLKLVRPYAPEDRELGIMLVEGLIAARQFEDARPLIEELLEAFGLRRSGQRAHVHALSAKVLAAGGDMQGALEQLETAHKMDSGNADIVRLLAELARDAGELERAERGYRALLLVVRQAEQEGGSRPAIGVGEVLVELSAIATDLGQREQASERFESALEALIRDPADARRAQDVLVKRREFDKLERLVGERMRRVDDPILRASVLDEYATLLEGPLEQPVEALPKRLESIECRPADPELHDRAQALAERLEQSETYVALLERLLERAKTQAQRYVRCELFLRLGGVAEQRGDLDGASAFYTRAEETGVREVDVWRAQAACAGARGDVEEQTRILSELANMGERQVETKTRADALYRLAEVRLSSEHTLAEGIESLTRALEEDPRYERAARILSRACVTEPVQPDLLVVYERVARASSDERLLLHFLELQSGRSDALPEEVREGAQLALRLEHFETAERLMLRAVEIARELPDGEARVSWALLSLCDRRQLAGDLSGAVQWLTSAAEVSDADEVLPRVRVLAEAALAASSGPELALGAQLCERVLATDPTARDAWEPLATIYARQGDRVRLEKLVDETLDSLEDSDDRNLLRMNYARLLMEQGGDDAQQAIEVLREVLIEDASHRTAQALLADLIERHGTAEEVIELLEEQLKAALSRRDGAAVRNTSLQLGGRVRARSGEEAATVYRNALEWMPEDAELLERLLSCVPEASAESVDVLERLVSIEEGDAAAAHALRAADIHHQSGDLGAARRVLELALERAPAHSHLLTKLEELYRTMDDARGLARLLRGNANRAESDQARVELLCELARIQRSGLRDPAAAVVTLEEAAELLPADERLALELAETLTAAGNPHEALERLSAGLEQCAPDRRGALLRARARAFQALGDSMRALSDLEEAFDLGGDDVAQELEAAFSTARREAASRGDADGERALVMRWVQASLARRDRARAGVLLAEWLDQRADDVEAMEQLMTLRKEERDFAGVAELCGRAIRWAEGAEQVRLALQLADACRLAENPEAAREDLEHVYANNRQSPELRSELKSLYEAASAFAELASLLLDDVAQCEDPAQKVPLLKQAGDSYFRAGEAALALEPLREALALDASDFDLLVQVVDAYIQAGRIDDANGLLDQGLEDPACKRGRRALLSQRKAWLARALGDQQVELSWLEEAFKHDRGNGHIALELADLAEALEQWDTADQALRGIALLKTDAPLTRGEAFLRQSRIWLMRGDHKRALAWARKAKQEEPDSEQVEAMLQQLSNG